MQRIEAFLSEGEVPNWASTLTCDNSPQQRKDIGFSDATFEWDDCSGDPAPSRFCLGPLNFIFPSGKLTLISGSTGSGKTALFSALLGGNITTLPDVNLSLSPSRDALLVRVRSCKQNTA